MPPVAVSIPPSQAVGAPSAMSPTSRPPLHAKTSSSPSSPSFSPADGSPRADPAPSIAVASPTSPSDPHDKLATPRITARAKEQVGIAHSQTLPVCHVSPVRTHADTYL
ncbi:uncharacterized protein LAESUDRAFT_670966 [Laetiporus sulphureus 93-53]|uniref:Uncharacterized protein n=1 Tax=Laetiporus sulphureus 93-53 TaxID=1314785 RepID=A0A165H4E6_9APHY|nr:uncharacterized protein LAESUDRAFT_670966 [Laetiporus sulphureus 93-53]KZT11228.1 hypothetical protein LAESUDRAFT_670966 [Laetiporus sulphureus 93-53]